MARISICRWRISAANTSRILTHALIIKEHEGHTTFDTPQAASFCAQHRQFTLVGLPTTPKTLAPGRSAAHTSSISAQRRSCTCTKSDKAMANSWLHSDTLGRTGTPRRILRATARCDVGVEGVSEEAGRGSRPQDI